MEISNLGASVYLFDRPPFRLKRASAGRHETWRLSQTGPPFLAFRLRIPEGLEDGSNTFVCVLADKFLKVATPRHLYELKGSL